MYLKRCLSVASRPRTPRFAAATVRPFVAGAIAFFLLSGVEAQAPALNANHARLWIILLVDSDLVGGLTPDRVRGFRNRFPSHPALLNAGNNTEVVLSTNFLAVLKGALELPEKPGAPQFRVLFAFQWATKPTSVELSRNRDATLPGPASWNSRINGQGEWYAHDRAAALDPSRGFKWRLKMTPGGKYFDFTPMVPP